MPACQAQAVAGTIREPGVPRRHPAAECPGQLTPSPPRPPEQGHRNGGGLTCLHFSDRSLVCLNHKSGNQTIVTALFRPIMEDSQNPAFGSNVSSKVMWRPIAQGALRWYQYAAASRA